ncbi:SCO7613 C-terminal domain-containing membrane protein [Nocardioides sp.]|uniref:SCO7613 C-terminal domain-containing membrane protein n=1 Tax=Nocardioides sp. TaxID=35761 RepID=UPI002C9C147E|nr:hypothetical protein [Nocardioides sp.]HXH80771.1 hypothetical protein [Nocardioides sp.]
MSAQSSFECPNCGTSLTVGTTTCGRCQIRLTGPEAVRLWEVDQQIGALSAERKVLIGALTGSGGRPAPDPWVPAPVAPTRSQLAHSGPGPAPAPAPYAPKKSVSGQQLLLGLGALLLLSAASFFLLVVWILVGVVGQALIMVMLTGVAVAGSVWATRRRLPAVAETAAIIATGFLYLDLSGAHARGLFGLDSLSYADYWVGASVVGGALLVGWDLLVPRLREGVALRRILTYRPAAAVLFAAAPWFVIASTLPERAWLSAAMLVVALTNLACGLVALSVDEAPATPTPGPFAPDAQEATTRRRLPLSALVLFASAALATLLYALTGLVAGYDPFLPPAERYSAFALLMLVPVALTVVSTRVGSRLTARVDPAHTRKIPAAAVAWTAPVLGIPLMDATYPVLVAVSVLVAIVATCLHLGLVRPATETGARWLQALSVAAYVAQPLLLAVVSVLVLAEHVSLRIMISFDQLADTVQDPSVLWMVVPGALWALSSTVGAVRRRSATWAFVAEVALLCTLVAALVETSAQTWMTVLLVAFAANVALACVAVRRGSYALVAPAGARVQGDPFWAGVDRTAVLFGAVYALGALASTFELSPGRQSLVLVTAGVLILVYAAAPARLPFAYLGSLAISAGTANLVREAGVETTEAYTAPLVLLLAAIGFVQWTRNKMLPTFLTMGPALAVAMGPSLLTSLGEGDELRLAAVTVAAIVILIVGLAQRWKAPVTAGGLVLIVVAITQGGPYVAYVPTWITLGAAGAALIAAGVAWEMAVVAGRRATTWYGSLH